MKELNFFQFVEDVMNGNFEVIDLKSIVIITILSALLLIINNNEI